MLKDRPAESQRLSADARVQGCMVLGCGPSPWLPIQAGLQVAADRRVGIIQGQAAEAHCC